MKYRPLGKTGMSVSEIGFGAWGIGGLTKGATSYGKTDDTESIKALRTAYNRGINFFDTSNVYGDGHSEELIGRTFVGERDKIIIASKVGFLEHNGPQDFSERYVNTSLNESLRRLKTDYLDLFQLHSPPMRIFGEGSNIVEVLSQLKEKGKIRAYGISAKSPEDAVKVLGSYPFDTVQINFNMTDQRAIRLGLFELCEEKGIGVIGRTPLCFGFLSGGYSTNYKFDRSDHRSTWSDEQIAVWANAYRLFLDAIDRNVQQTNSQFALRFCLSYDAVSTVIPGMLNEREVVENARASDIGPLKEPERERLEEICKSNVFFLGQAPTIR